METHSSRESRIDAAASAEHAAGARSRAYLLFAEAFEYPEEEQRDAIRGKLFTRGLREALEEIEPGLASNCHWDALAEAGQGDELAIEFTRLFDVGPAGPPCPLHGGLYGGTRMKTMEEVVRFYNHFGLTLSEERRELPDHITTELEFLHYLAYREAEAARSGADTSSWRRAQRDFIDRHPGRWVVDLQQRVEAHSAPVFYVELVRLLRHFLTSERDRLSRAAPFSGEAPAGGRAV